MLSQCQMKESSEGIRLCSQQRSTKDQTRREWKQSKKSFFAKMISNWPFLPPARISRTVLAATLDLPTILPLKASFESGSTPKEVTITSNSTVERRRKQKNLNLETSSGKREIFQWRRRIYSSQAIELHLFNKEEEGKKYTPQSKGADDT